MKAIEWKTQTGEKVKVTIELKLEKEINLDGDICKVSCCDLEIFAEVEGMGTVGFGKPIKRQGLPEDHVACIGKLAITEKQCQKIEEAITDIKQHPAWIEKQARIKANEKAEEEHYKHLKDTGYCFKCHSYCYGDCES